MWIPMLDGDERASVDRAAGPLAPDAPTQYWDGAQALGKAIARGFGEDRPAWDIYLFYGGDAVWTDASPPAPAAVLAQVGSRAGTIVIGSPGALPPAVDQSALPDYLRGRAVIVGDPDELERLLAAAAARWLQ